MGRGELTLVGGIKLWWWSESTRGGNFLGGGGGEVVEGGLHPISPVGKFMGIKNENFNMGVH